MVTGKSLVNTNLTSTEQDALVLVQPVQPTPPPKPAKSASLDSKDLEAAQSLELLRHSLSTKS